jgi:replicative DNA helicase
LTNSLLNSHDAEKAVLGAILLSNGKVFDELTLTADDFSNSRLGQLYTIAKRMFINGEPVDVLTFTAEPEFLKIGAVRAADIHELTAFVPTAANVSYYADIVYEAAVRRRVQEAAAEIGQAAQSLEFSYLTENSRQKLDKALGIRTNSISFVVDEINETIDSMSLPSKAYPTPWALLTKAIGGFRSGSLYTIGARPGKGKTSIGLQCALELSRHGSVAFSSLEMRRQELHKRIISINANVSMDSVMNNNMSESDWERVARHREDIIPNIAIDDRAEVSVHDIRTFARSVNRVMPLKGVVVDYLQLMSSKDNRPRHEIVAEMSRQLKIMARDLDIPVIALSQLNRQSEARVDKRPSLSDLRESGAIEQDSDVVILLHQEDDVMILDVAKNRQGPPSIVRLHWQGDFARAVS